MNTVLTSGSSLIVHMYPSLSACPNHTSNDEAPGCDMLSAVPRSRLLPQASPLPSRLAPCSHRIGFTCVQADRSASGGFPPRLATTQFPLAADAHAGIGLRLSRAEFMYLMTHWVGAPRAVKSAGTRPQCPPAAEAARGPHRPPSSRQRPKPEFHPAPPCRAPRQDCEIYSVT